MPDGRHFEDRQYAITLPRIIRSSPNFASGHGIGADMNFKTNIAKILKSKIENIQ